MEPLIEAETEKAIMEAAKRLKPTVDGEGALYAAIIDDVESLRDDPMAREKIMTAAFLAWARLKHPVLAEAYESGDDSVLDGLLKAARTEMERGG